LLQQTTLVESWQGLSLEPRAIVSSETCRDPHRLHPGQCGTVETAALSGQA